MTTIILSWIALSIVTAFVYGRLVSINPRDDD
jgi:ABC-type uncharacterized transport system permease subunit